MSDPPGAAVPHPLPFRVGLCMFLAFALPFVGANRAAFKNWFSDDDLDNLWMMRDQKRYADLAAGFASPKLADFNFRPTGHVVYKIFSERFGLSFAPWIVLLFAAHLLDCWLVWLIVRRLGAPAAAAALGTFMFGFHMACFSAWWQPMYIFDLLCGVFVRLSLYAYLRGWLIAPLLFFWTAYKAKELAVALPAVLLAYEHLLGGRRWRRVAPYAAIAAVFAVQGVLANAASDNDYTLRYTAGAVAKTFAFYASKIFLIPYAGAILIPLAFLTKDRTARFGLLSIGLFMGPLWFLPGRLYAVYLYVPLIGLAIAASALMRSIGWRLAVIAAVAWTGLHYAELRNARRKALTEGPENRAYVEAAARFMRANPDITSYVYDGGPAAMNVWGVEAAFKYHGDWSRLRLAPANSDAGRRLMEQPPFAVAAWNGRDRKLVTAVRRAEEDSESYIDMASAAPAWQFEEGWHPLEAGFRWTAPVARLRLRRPALAKRFSLTINLGEAQMKAQGGVEVELSIGGQSLGVREFRQPGWHAQSWALPEGPEGETQVELRTLRPLKPANDPRVLGAAVVALGFGERQ
jgi:hypothetical protein